MNPYVEFDGQLFQLELSQACSIAIPLTFDEHQPNHFGAAQADQGRLRGLRIHTAC